MHNIVTVTFKDSNTATANGVRQWDYGQILRIQGLQLPTAVEVHFALIDSKDSVTRIGTTKDGVTDVVIPDSMIEAGKNIFAYVYLRDSESGQTEYEIKIVVTTRAKPEAFDTPEDKELFAKAIEAVNEAADRAEKAGQAATEAAGQAAEDAQQTAEDRKEVEKMVETVSDISEQVKKVEQLSQQAQDAATKTEADAQQTAEDRVEVGKMLETVKDVSEQVKSVEESVQKAKESEQAAAGHRAAVEEMKNSVEQTASTFPQTVQEGVQAVENTGTAEVQEITQAGTAQKTAVEGAGTQAVNSVENAQQAATEAVGEAKTTALQAVQAEGTKQTGNVTAEGTKQVKAVQDKGTEVLQSIPEDFQTQMESKLDKNQGAENAGKALVIGEDGGVVPGKPQTEGTGDGADAIVNTASGEVISVFDSSDRKNKGFRMTGKTAQVTTTGKKLLNEELLKTLTNYTTNEKDYYYYRFSGLEIGKKYTISRSNVKSGSGVLFGISVNQESYNSAKFLVYDGLGSGYNNASITWSQTTGDYVDILFSINANVTQSTQEKLTEFWERLSYVQLEEGSTASANEPYTGGKPSPSPEYPQEITNSGKWNEEKQKYEVDLKITSKNLFDIDYLTKNENYQNKDGEPTNWKYATLKVEPNATYTVSKNKNSRVNGGINNDLNFAGALTFYGDTKSVKITSKDTGLLYVMFYYRNEDVNVLKEIDIQVELGEKLTDYAPYAKQLLTLTSDRPLTQWDKLVEQDGQIGWLYGSKRKIIGNDMTWVSSNNTENMYFTTTISDAAGLINTSLCKTYRNNGDPAYNSKYSGQFCIYSDHPTKGVGDKCFRPPNETIITLAQWKEWIAENPIEMWYQTKTTEFVPLPDEEQVAIRNLRTYYPSTTLTNDQGCVMELDYVCDTKLYIDNKVSAKVANIISQYQLNTANLLSLMPMETQATMIENDTNNILNNLESEETHE